MLYFDDLSLQNDTGPTSVMATLRRGFGGKCNGSELGFRDIHVDKLGSSLSHSPSS